MNSALAPEALGVTGTAFLHEKWRMQAARIISLGNLLEDTKASDKNSSSLRYKLEKILDQISFFKKKEKDIIEEIDAMEQKHRYMREHNMLRKADGKPKPLVLEDEEEYDEESKPRDTLGTLLLIWVFSKLLRSPFTRRSL